MVDVHQESRLWERKLDADTEFSFSKMDQDIVQTFLFDFLIIVQLLLPTSPSEITVYEVKNGNVLSQIKKPTENTDFVLSFDSTILAVSNGVTDCIRVYGLFTGKL